MVLTRANWYLDHKSIGRLTVGRQDTATAGLTTIDLGGAGVVANASISYWQSGFILTTTSHWRSGRSYFDLERRAWRQHGQRFVPEPRQFRQVQLPGCGRVLGLGGLGRG